MTTQETPTSHSFFSQRLRLHYLEWPQLEWPQLERPHAGERTTHTGHTPAMLLLHGLHDHCHSWDWLAPAFRHRYRVIAPDLRGHGDSEWTRGSSYSYVEHVQDVAQLVRQQQLAPVTLIAHSLGGTVASIYAGVYPEAVERLVVIEGVGLYPRAAQPADARLRKWIEANRSLSARAPRRYATLEDACQRMQQANPHLSPEQARHLTLHGSSRNEDGTFTWKFDNYTRTPRPRDIADAELAELWQRIRAPVLVINSAHGYPHRIGHDDTLRYFRNAQLLEVDDAGHWTHHDRLQTCLDAIGAFLGDARATPA